MQEFLKGKSYILIFAVGLLGGLLLQACNGDSSSELATTTASAGASIAAIADQTGQIQFQVASHAALFVNADTNGDGINDVIEAVVDPPIPPNPGTPSGAPARYRLVVTDGATGVTLHNIDVSSPDFF